MSSAVQEKSLYQETSRTQTAQHNLCHTSMYCHMNLSGTDQETKLLCWFSISENYSPFG